MKNYALFLCICLFVVACQTPKTDYVALYKPIVETELAALNTGDLSLLDKYNAPDLVRYNGTTVINGLAASKEQLKTLPTLYDDLKQTLDEVVATENHVVARYTNTGKFKGTNLTFTVVGMTMYEIKENKIVRSWSALHALDELRKLGFTITPPALPIAAK